MCGLIAVIGPSSTQDHRIRKAMDLLSHRGPDHAQVKHNNGFLFAHTRLSIIDLNPEANQPFEKNGSSIIFNGEIYNYRDLRNELAQQGVKFTSDSDTEVLLEGVLKEGSIFLKKIRGMFAFVLYDASKQEFFGARDRFGERPLLYSRSEDSIVFCSEFKSIFKYMNREFALSHNALKLYLHYQFIPEPHTLDENIHKIPAGSFFRLKLNSTDLIIESYWSFKLAADEGMNLYGRIENVAEHIFKLFSKAIERNLTSDVPVALSLSAGIDSGAIAAMARSLNPHLDFHAFTLGYSDYPAIDERPGAKKLANELNIKLHSIEISTQDFVKDFETLTMAMDEPIADPAAYSHYLIPKQAHDSGFKVLLSGIGGDEFSWGYSWLKNAVDQNRKLIKNKPNFLSKFLPYKNSKQDVPEFLYFYQELKEYNSIFDLIKEIDFEISSTPEIESLIAGEMPPHEKEIALYVQQTLVRTWMTGNCLTLADRVGMYNSIESRMPFLDADLTEYMIYLTSQNKTSDLDPKHYLKKAFTDLLPEYVLSREKTGFRIPNRIWMTSIIQEYKENLINGYFTTNKMINRSLLGKLLDKKDQSWHEQFFLYKILLLEVWMTKLSSL